VYRVCERVFANACVLIASLQELLAKEPLERTKIVVFESVYSMSGTVGLIKEILDLCDKYNALSFIDEVHAVGLYGAHGAGLMDAIGQRARASIVSGTLGKGFGVTGGFITSSASIVDCIRSAAPSFIFTGAMVRRLLLLHCVADARAHAQSPPLTAGALAAVAHARSPLGDIERRQMRHMASHLKRRVRLVSCARVCVMLCVGRSSRLDCH
jgi:5-aminolevulinate synthase